MSGAAGVPVAGNWPEGAAPGATATLRTFAVVDDGVVPAITDVDVDGTTDDGETVAGTEVGDDGMADVGGIGAIDEDGATMDVGETLTGIDVDEPGVVDELDGTDDDEDGGMLDDDDDEGGTELEDGGGTDVAHSGTRAASGAAEPSIDVFTVRVALAGPARAAEAPRTIPSPSTAQPSLAPRSMTFLPLVVMRLFPGTYAAYTSIVQRNTPSDPK
jgi:hypothetical protein